MGLLDNFLGGKPTALNLSAPVLDVSSQAVNQAIKDAGVVPQADSNTINGGFVDENGKMGAQVIADEKLGKNLDAVEQGSWAPGAGWKIGAWIKGSWGKK